MDRCVAGLIGSFGQKLKQKMNTIADDAKREKLRAQLRHDIGRMKSLDGIFRLNSQRPLFLSISFLGALADFLALSKVSSIKLPRKKFTDKMILRESNLHIHVDNFL